MRNAKDGAVVAKKPSRGVAGLALLPASRALDALDVLTLGDGTTSYPGAYALALRAFAREMASRGFAFGPGGTVTETWRSRARGRWLDADGIVFPETGRSVADAKHLIRVEGPHTIEVFSDGFGQWQATVDGRDLAAFASRAEAMRYVLEQVGAPRRK